MESPLHETVPDGLEVIETFGYTPKTGFARLGLHLDRAEVTCVRLNFPFDRGVALQTIGEAVADTPARVRMTVDATGRVTVTAADLAEAKRLWRVGVAEVRLNANDPWLRVKTTHRVTYDTVRAAMPSGVDEVIFLNEQDQICEGTITNVFVEKDGVLITPPLVCGLLPGVLRQELLDSGEAVEAILTVDDLSDGFYLGNSLRGLIEAELG